MRLTRPDLYFLKIVEFSHYYECGVTEAFTTARHLEYVWDWKKFSTPYLYRGPNTFVEISIKHHFKFYFKEKKPFVQTKDYARDPL